MDNIIGRSYNQSAQRLLQGSVWRKCHEAYQLPCQLAKRRSHTTRSCTVSANNCGRRCAINITQSSVRSTSQGVLASKRCTVARIHVRTATMG